MFSHFSTEKLRKKLTKRRKLDIVNEKTFASKQFPIDTSMEKIKSVVLEKIEFECQIQYLQLAVFGTSDLI